MMFLTPMISRAMRCSFVCGCGHSSFAVIKRSAPSMIAAPESMVAINVSCPGASMKETVLVGVALAQQGCFPVAPCSGQW